MYTSKYFYCFIKIVKMYKKRLPILAVFYKWELFVVDSERCVSKELTADKVASGNNYV